MFLLVLVISTLVFPGVGHVTLGRTWRGCAFAALAFIALATTAFSVFGLAAWLALRGVATLDLIWCARVRETRASYLVGLGVAAASVLGMVALRLVVIVPFGVPSASMEPTVLPGDSVIVNLRARPPARGAIVAFVQPCERDHTYLKRVVAIGGDTVELRCHVLHVNGALVPPGAALTGDTDRGDFPSLTLPFSPHCSNAPAQPTGKLVAAPGPHGPCDPQLHLVVPPDTVFVLGDNRPASHDSREFGVVPLDDLVGGAVGIYTPAHFGDLR